MGKWALIAIVFFGFINWYASEKNSLYSSEVALKISQIHNEDVILYATGMVRLL